MASNVPQSKDFFFKCLDIIFVYKSPLNWSFDVYKLA